MFRSVIISVLLLATSVAALEGEVRPESAPIHTSWEMVDDTLVIQIRNLSPNPINEVYLTDHQDVVPSVVSLTLDSRPLRGDWIQFSPSPIYPGKISAIMTVGPFDSLVVIKLLAPDAKQENLNWFTADQFNAFGYFSSCCNKVGDINHESGIGNVDISDLTFLVSYLFKLGAAPECAAEADLTGDGNVNISDLTSLVDYFFRGSGELRSCSL